MTKSILFALSLLSSAAAFADTSQSINPALVSLATNGHNYVLYVYDKSGKQVETTPIDPNSILTPGLFEAYNQKIAEARTNGQNLKITKLDNGGVAIFPDNSKPMDPLCSGPGTTAAGATSPIELSKEPTSINPYFVSIGIEGKASFFGQSKYFLYIYDPSGKPPVKFPVDPSGQIPITKLVAEYNQRISMAKANHKMLKITKAEFNGLIGVEQDTATASSICPESTAAAGTVNGATPERKK